MADKLPFIAAFIAAGCVIGYFIFSHYKRRKEYFYELNDFVGSYLSSIMYSKDSIVRIVENFETSSALLRKHLDEYVAHKRDKQPLELSGGCIKKGELSFVKSLLGMMGTSDAATQKSGINARRGELIKYLESAEDKFKRYGGSSIKLGLLGGLLLSVVCM